MLYKRSDFMEYEFKTLTLENLDSEHICCAISDKKGECGVSSKKAWLRERIQEGLVFLKLDVRGKVFIEYIPAEKAWCPIDADGYMFIDCFWVSGQYKGKGFANMLLERCIADAEAKGKKGLAVLSSKKKLPFLSDPKYLKYKGFMAADEAESYFELLYLPFDKNAEKPKFKDCAKSGKTDKNGWILYYTDQCPHTAKHVPLLIEAERQRGIYIKAVKLETAEEARNCPSPFTTYSLFYDGSFVTNEILSEKSFEKYKSRIENVK